MNDLNMLFRMIMTLFGMVRERKQGKKIPRKKNKRDVKGWRNFDVYLLTMYTKIFCFVFIHCHQQRKFYFLFI